MREFPRDTGQPQTCKEGKKQQHENENENPKNMKEKKALQHLTLYHEKT